MLQFIIMYINCDHNYEVRTKRVKRSMDIVVDVIPELYCDVCKSTMPVDTPEKQNIIDQWFSKLDKLVTSGVSA